jgi:hypothetical protein
MANRVRGQQLQHDAAVYAAKQIYEQHGKHAWVNPGAEKNKAWSGKYIDVIAVNNVSADRAWVIEVETEDSVSDSEAKDQWKDYDSVFTTRWYLAVPLGSEIVAKNLLQKHGISHCTVITWQENPNGTQASWGLPGLT